MKSTREQLIARIKLDPAGYVAERIAYMDDEDVKRLLVSLAGTDGIGREIQNGPV